MVIAVRDTAPPIRTIRDVLLRVQGEYRDMPGLKLTEAQAQRLLGIDCDACVPECPVEAVFSEANVPAEWTSFTPLNAERALSGLPTITARLDPLCE